MKTSNLAFALGAVLAIGSPGSAVLAQDKPAQLIDESDARADDDDTVRCKRLPPPVGSRMGGKRVCRTNAQWRLEKETNEAGARENQQRGTIANERTYG